MVCSYLWNYNVVHEISATTRWGRS